VTLIAAFIRVLRRTFSVSDITNVPSAMRYGRQLTGEFGIALLDAGVIDRTATGALHYVDLLGGDSGGGGRPTEPRGMRR
jgi:hypothetical protein